MVAIIRNRCRDLIVVREDAEFFQPLKVKAQQNGSRHVAGSKLEYCGADPGGAMDIDQRSIIFQLNLDLVILGFGRDKEIRLPRLRVCLRARTGYKQEAKQDDLYMGVFHHMERTGKKLETVLTV